jgi:hypothetical protein
MALTEPTRPRREEFRFVDEWMEALWDFYLLIGLRNAPRKYRLRRWRRQQLQREEEKR